MNRRRDVIRREIHSPPGMCDPADWLRELSEMRARVLYDGGRRPSFRLLDGTFEDRDAHDEFAYHLIARASMHAIGSIRLVPLDTPVGSVTEEAVGTRPSATRWLSCEFNASMPQNAAAGLSPPNGENTLVGMRLVAGIIAIGRHLGYRMLIGPTGVRDGQASLLTAIGMRPLPCLPRVHVPRYDDELAVLYLLPSLVERSFARVIGDMATRLDVDGLCPPKGEMKLLGAARLVGAPGVR
jgi:hypothetical protein